MKSTKILLTVSFFIGMLLGLTPRAMSRVEVPGQSSGASKEPAVANPTSREKALEGMSILYGTNENANTSIPPPPMLKLFQGGNYLTTEQSQFIVTYKGFTDEAREAFQYAVDIWNALIRSPVPIRIDAFFTHLGEFDGENVILAQAGPADWRKHGSLDLWFPEALADQRAGRDLADGKPDIITQFNSHEDANWYFGTDGNTPAGKTDFVSTVLHEIAHGLGFFSFASVEERAIPRFTSSGGTGKLRGGTRDLPYIYDTFVENGSGTTILSFPDPSFALENQITSNDLFWNGKIATAANGGFLPHLYAPSSWEEGSSYTHLDEITFPAGNANSLMTPYLANQEAVHDPGPIALGMLEDMEWIINKAPVFTDGSGTTRTIVNRSIRNPVSAADADNDALIYHLSGTDAEAFDIDSTTGQLKTKATHTYNKAAYTVTVTVSDGTLIDEITVTINVTGTETETPTNSSPSFVDGSHTSRTVAENTAKGVNIGNPITATDTDNDALTYTLSGPDAAAFDIDNTTGQLKTKAELDYETKNAYTVTVTVSDGNLTITITVIIIIIDLDDQKSPTLTLTSQPLTETTLNGSIVVLSLNNRIYENWLSDPVTVSGISGVTVRPFDVNRVSDTELSVQLTFYGTDLDTDTTLTFTVKADAIANYDGPNLTATAHVTANAESVVASTTTRLTEATLNRNVVTLTLNGGIYESQYTVGNSVTVSGITGVTVNTYNVERLSDTQVNVELIFDGTDFDTDATLTFTVGADAVTGYNGTALIAQLPVSAVVEQSPIITAYATQPLTEATLNESIVTLTLSSGVYTQSNSDISSAVQVSGIAGVRFLQSDVGRVSATKVTLKLIFDDTDFDTDATLTFTVGADAITEYEGPALTAAIPVAAVIEESPTITAYATQSLTEATLNGSIIRLRLNNGTYARANFDAAVKVSGIAGVTIGIFGVERVTDTDIIFQLEFNGNLETNATLTFTVEADAIAEYDGPALIAHIIVDGGQESVVASTETHLTETTLNGSVVTLTLNGATYERSTFDLRDAVSVSGIEGATFHWFDLDRVSDTALTVALTFKGNIDTDATLTFTVGADAIADYNGTPLSAQVTVIGGKESVTASSEAPLTETTLDDSIVTLTLTGRNYARSSYDIERAVTIAGIEGVTIYDVDRNSNTEITVELRFNGDIDTDAILTFTVGPNAIANYNGPAFTTQVSVSGGHESIAAATEASLTETTLDDSVVTLTLTGRNYTRSSYDIERAMTIAGIEGVIIYDVDRISNTKITVELTFNGDIDTDAVLTFTVGAGAIADYNGPAFTAQVSVSGGHESIAAATKAPLTEATLDDSVVTLTLTGRAYVRSSYDIERAMTIAGIDGATIYDVDRISSTEITVELTFNGDFDADAILTLTVGADAIAGYNGPTFTAQLPVTGGHESIAASTETPLTETTLDDSVVTLTLTGRAYVRSSYDIERAMTIAGIDGVTIYDVDRISSTEITVELTFNGDFDADTTLTLTVGADAIAGYNGPTFTAQLPVTGGHESIAASTGTPLTEATLDDSVVTLTLTGRAYVRSSYDIERAMTIAGIDGATVYDVDRNSNTEITVELAFNGDFDADATLTFTVGPNAIANYNGPALTTQISVTGAQEAIVASTDAPLTEATLDESVVTLTLTGRKYARSTFDIRRAVSVSGIDGVTIPWHEPDRKNDTEITVELEFDGNINVDSTLTFTVGAGAIAGYNGPALTAQITVTADRENALLANFPNPFNPETWIPYHLAKPTEVTITIYAVNGQAVRTLALGHQPAGIYQTRSRAAYWDGRNAFGEPVASGVYFYTLTAGDFSATRKMLIRK